MVHKPSLSHDQRMHLVELHGFISLHRRPGFSLTIFSYSVSVVAGFGFKCSLDLWIPDGTGSHSGSSKAQEEPPPADTLAGPD